MPPLSGMLIFLFLPLPVLFSMQNISFHVERLHNVLFFVVVADLFMIDFTVLEPGYLLTH